jgi:hypothetical protein
MADAVARIVAPEVSRAVHQHRDHLLERQPIVYAPVMAATSLPLR